MQNEILGDISYMQINFKDFSFTKMLNESVADDDDYNFHYFY